MDDACPDSENRKSVSSSASTLFQSAESSGQVQSAIGRVSLPNDLQAGDRSSLEASKGRARSTVQSLGTGSLAFNATSSSSTSWRVAQLARAKTGKLCTDLKEKFGGNEDIRAATMGLRQPSPRSHKEQPKRSSMNCDVLPRGRTVAPQAILFDDIVSAKNRHANAKLQADLRFNIMPWSPRLTLWRTIMVAMVLWAVIMAPLEIAFSWWEPADFLVLITKASDIFCIIDMFMNFFIVTVKYGKLETKRTKIVYGYLRSWFLLDAVTNIPWDIILSGGGRSKNMIKVLKLPKVLRLTRLFRVAREEAHTLGTVFTISGMLLLSHYFACTWIWLLVKCKEGDTCPDKATAYAEGMSVGMATLSGSDAWLRFILEGPQSGTDSAFEWYSSPNWAAEIVAMTTCLIGLCALGMLFGNIANAMDKTDSHTRKFNERLQNVKSACVQHGLNKEIHNRARRHFHFIWSCGSDSSRELLADQALSVDLRRELAFGFYGDLLRKVPFLANAEENLLKQLCKNAKMEVFSPPDNIILAGEMGTELFFLVSGSVNVLNPTNGAVLRTLDEGSFFGEVALFFPESGHSVDVRAISFGWLLVVERDYITQLCDEDLLEAFKNVAQERQEYGFSSLGRNSYLNLDERKIAEESAPALEPAARNSDESTPNPQAPRRPSVRVSARHVDAEIEAMNNASHGHRRMSHVISSRSDDGELFEFANRMEAKIDLWATTLLGHLGHLDPNAMVKSATEPAPQEHSDRLSSLELPHQIPSEKMSNASSEPPKMR